MYNANCDILVILCKDCQNGLTALDRQISYGLTVVRRPEAQIGESAYPVSPIGNFGTLM